MWYEHLVNPVQHAIIRDHVGLHDLRTVDGNTFASVRDISRLFRLRAFFSIERFLRLNEIPVVLPGPDAQLHG